MKEQHKIFKNDLHQIATEDNINLDSEVLCRIKREGIISIILLLGYNINSM